MKQNWVKIIKYGSNGAVSFLFLLVVFINIVQFIPTEYRAGKSKTVQDVSGTYLRALAINKTNDIIDLFMGLKNVEGTSRIFTELREYAPGVEIVVPNTNILGKRFGFTQGEEFLSGSLGIGQANSIKYRSFIPESIQWDQKSEVKVAHGELWMNPSQTRSGKPGVKWSLVLNMSRPPEQLIVIDLLDKYERIILDTSLLTDESRKELAI